MKASIKGLGQITKNLNKIKNNINQLEGTYDIPVGYSQEKWDKLTKKEQDKIINELVDNFKKEAVQKILN